MLLCGAADPAIATLDAAFAAHAAGDWRTARHAFARLAGEGSAVGETMLGAMYDRGQGVRRDPATAAGWWLRAASRGYAPAQLAFARARAAGRGVAADPADAWRWARIAETHGGPPIAAEARRLRLALAARVPAADLPRLEERAQGWRPWSTLKP